MSSDSANAMRRVLVSGDGWGCAEHFRVPGPPDTMACSNRSAFLAVVLDGSFHYESERLNCDLTTGSVLLSGEHSEFRCEYPHDQGYRAVVFDFSADYFENLAAGHGCSRQPIEERMVMLTPSRAALLEDVRNALSTGDPAALESIGVRLGAAVLGGRTRATSELDRRRIADAVNFIEASYAAPLSLRDMALHVGLSPYHFLRVFRDVTGVTPHDFLVRTRLGAAAAKLRSREESVTSVAMSVGFGDLSNFTRRFRSTFGVTPGQYARVRRAAGDSRL